MKISKPDSITDEPLDDWQLTSSLEAPLRFSFQDGKVEDLCPSDEDNVQSINLKRGVLSAFQHSMNQHTDNEDMQEVDKDISNNFMVLLM